MQTGTCPTGMHCQNVTEVAIKTFKEHFISIIAGLPESFPIRMWCKPLPQAELTLNILRPSHARPNISAHAYMFGPFDFNRTPLAPIDWTCSDMRIPAIEVLGPSTQLTVVSWDNLLSITDPSDYHSKSQAQNTYATR